MAKKLDPQIAKVLQDYGFGADSAWDCHGTWVVYHRVLEQIAAKAGIVFDAPLPLETNGAGKSVAICVTGRKDGVAEWSIGESAPGNNKNAYPYAMAEKRAKDRVILKLIGQHGLAYSEDEADDFKASTPAQSPAPVAESPKQPVKAAVTPSNTVNTVTEALLKVIKTARSVEDLKTWWTDPATQDTLRRLSQTDFQRVTEAKGERQAELIDGVPA